VNLSGREGWIYPAAGQRSHRNPGFPQFGCLDIGACQVIREIKTVVLLPGSCKVRREPVLKFRFRTTSNTFGVSLGFEGCMCLVPVLLGAERLRNTLHWFSKFVLHFLQTSCGIRLKVAALPRSIYAKQACRRQRGTCGPGTRCCSRRH